MKMFLFSLAAIVCTPLLAMQQSEHDPLPASTQEQEVNMRAVLADDAMILCDSMVNLDGLGIPQTKTAYTYDANGNQLKLLYSEWKEGAWVDSYKYEYTYDSNNAKTSTVHYTFHDGVWIGETKYEYTYDAKGNMTSEVYYLKSATIIQYTIKGRFMSR